MSLERILPRIGRGETNFRWRGRELTRLEAFSDAVFAFAVTLLVVSLDVPRTFDQLLDTMKGLPAFALCFAMLVMIWHYHGRFFHRYGLADPLTTALNALLMFLVLLYVYPLKFLFGWLIAGSPATTMMPGGEIIEVIRDPQIRTLMWIYSSGYSAIFAIFALLHMRAWRLRKILELNEIERAVTRGAIHGHLLMLSVGLASLCIALLAPVNWMWAAGLIYSLTGPVMGIHGWRVGKAVGAATH